MNHTLIKLQLDLAAEKVIHQLVLSNEHVEQQMTIGIQKAIEGFDFEKEVEHQTQNAIKEAIRKSLDYGKLKQLILKKSEAILDAFVEKELERYNNLKQ